MAFAFATNTARSKLAVGCGARLAALPDEHPADKAIVSPNASPSAARRPRVTACPIAGGGPGEDDAGGVPPPPPTPHECQIGREDDDRGQALQPPQQQREAADLCRERAEPANCRHGGGLVPLRVCGHARPGVVVAIRE